MVENLPGETWLPVPEFPDYLVSDKGRVKGLARKVKVPSGFRDFEKDLPERLLGHTDKKTYLQIHLYDGSKIFRTTKHWNLAKLVLTVFSRPQCGQEHVTYVDGDYKNCALINVAWAPGLTRSSLRRQTAT